MRGFLKSFLATILALIVFTVAIFFAMAGFVGGLLTPKKAEVEAKSVLVLDLSQALHEQLEDNPLSAFGGEDQVDQPGVYDVVRLVRHAKGDSAIKGIYLKCNEDPNGFATNEEIRLALQDFRKSGKFVYAYGESFPQKAYYVANIADKIYCNPKGSIDWRGFSAQMAFVKGTLQKLDIQPQIFYAGKFKSATEPLREEKMTDANRLQLTELLSDFYNRLMYSTAAARHLDTTELRRLVNEHLVQRPRDAVEHKLIDGLKYDDEVKDELRGKLGIDKHSFINFIPIGKYARAVDYKQDGKDKICLIYAEGDIVDGKGDKGNIGSDNYRSIVRKARFDKDVKAIVIRVNSGGGSSLASENIWREVSLARKEKPVVVSFGDVAASGAYYLSCAADSVFAMPGTITGSIGVFILVPNLSSFFQNKLGITFDGVRTAPDADPLTVTKPLTPSQRQYLQDGIDSTYMDFKTRVADGRGKTLTYVDSIAQGRVWSGVKGLDLGLVDKIGTLQDAIDCAARMAKTSDYRLREYPEPKNILDQVLGGYRRTNSAKAMKEELGAEGYKTYSIIKGVQSMVGVSQAKLPWDLTIE